MNTVGDLKLLPVWVNPQHLTLTAVHIMLGHKIKALAVLDGEQLVGTVSLEDLLKAPSAPNVAAVMSPVENVVDANRDIRELADQFVKNEWEFAPVMRDTKFAGMVTPVILLKELGRSFDPLTRLSWSDLLREWGVDHLKNSEEVTIIFIDLNQFGSYNKKYGHIVGDRVIRKVADFLRENIDPELDVLVRYGGDEFCIGTLRDRDESEALAKVLQSRFVNTSVEGADEPVSFSVGLFGGRRHKERENVHYAATIDNLINIASRNCQLNKQATKAASAQREEAPAKSSTSVPKPRPVPYQVLNVFAPEEGNANGITTVILTDGTSVFSGADARGDKSIPESVAQATAKAVERATGTVIALQSVDIVRSGEVSLASIAGMLTLEGEKTPRTAARPVGANELESIAEAVVEAFCA